MRYWRRFNDDEDRADLHVVSLTDRRTRNYCFSLSPLQWHVTVICLNCAPNHRRHYVRQNASSFWVLESIAILVELRFLCRLRKQKLIWHTSVDPWSESSFRNLIRPDHRTENWWKGRRERQGRQRSKRKQVDKRRLRERWSQSSYDRARLSLTRSSTRAHQYQIVVDIKMYCELLLKEYPHKEEEIVSMRCSWVTMCP